MKRAPGVAALPLIIGWHEDAKAKTAGVIVSSGRPLLCSRLFSSISQWLCHHLPAVLPAYRH